MGSYRICATLMIRACVSQRPRLVDMGRVYRQTNLENLEQAFNVAEKDLGVTRLLDPEGKRPKSPLPRLDLCKSYNGH